MNLADQKASQAIVAAFRSMSAGGKAEVVSYLTGELKAAVDGCGPEARTALLAALPSSPNVEATLRNYPGRGGRTQEAIDFKLLLSTESTARASLTEFLGAENAGIVISSWGSRVNFDVNTPGENKLTLLTRSGGKTRIDLHQDLAVAGLEFVDDLQATIICAALVKKARDVGLNLTLESFLWKAVQKEALGKFSEAEIDLLTKLVEGALRTRSGALGIRLDPKFNGPGSWSYNKFQLLVGTLGDPGYAGAALAA